MVYGKYLLELTPARRGERTVHMTLKTWEKSLTHERQAELERMANKAETARECDEESTWAEHSEHCQDAE